MLQARLVEQALRTAREAAVGPVTLWGAPDTRDPFFAHCKRVSGAGLFDQGGGDLGSRMLDAFERLAPAPVLLIGTDCPAMNPADLRVAADVLRSGSDAVFLPAEDGGYCLVGLARPVRRLFEGIAWGTDTVMSGTRATLRAVGLSWAEPATLWDVDRPEDVDRLLASGVLTGWVP